MKCEKCNQNEASFFFEKNLNGHKESLHLCHACAEAEGLLQKAGGFGEGLFSPLFSGVFPSLFTAPVKKPLTKQCSGCGTTWQEIAAEGKVFCPQCYADFREELSRTVRSIHGNVTHTGEMPAKLSAVQEKENKKAALKKALEAAIAAENFEEAATLRDEIRTLEGKEG